MAARGPSTYSRFVRTAKVLLPIIALILLSSIFLLARRIDPEASIPYADFDVRELAREKGMSAPTYSGKTSDGATIKVTAARVKPDLTNPDTGTATNILARLDWESGRSIDVAADTAVLDNAVSVIELHENAVITSSDGMTLRSQLFVARTDVTDVTSPGAVSGDGPFGTLDAGNMHLRAIEEDGSDYIVDFADGVKLVYEPER